jgi:hypothetical protein
MIDCAGSSPYSSSYTVTCALRISRLLSFRGAIDGGAIACGKGSICENSGKANIDVSYSSTWGLRKSYASEFGVEALRCGRISMTAELLLVAYVA